MSSHSFRFLHAACFRLECPLHGIPEVTEDLVELLSEAPLASAGHVFAAAVREEVDFVLLSGDILNADVAGPRVVTFLQTQFRRLQEQQISVYWAGSRRDLTGEWLQQFDWPDNVCIFGADAVQRVAHRRGDRLLAEICGRSWHAERPLRAVEFAGDSAEVDRVVVAGEALDPQKVSRSALYWALGGSASASTPIHGEAVAHCPGSPQGLTAQESGPHGCTLVQVDAERRIELRTIAADAVRWHRERIEVDSGMSRQELRGRLKARALQLRSNAERPLLVTWMLSGGGRFDSIFVDQEEQRATLLWLRDEFGNGKPALWSTHMELEPTEQLPPQWCEEDTILGDYLRVIQRYLDDPEAALGLERCFPAAHPPRALARILEGTRTKSGRNELLREAAALGADLLRGDEAPKPLRSR